METVYSIHGMTCNGCRTSVEQKIAGLDVVKEVNVSLEEEKAIILSTKKLDIAILREVLTPKYTIQEQLDHSGHSQADTVYAMPEVSVSKWKQLKPLFLILGYIAVASILLHRSSWDGKEMMLDFMGLFFIVFSFFKVLDLKGFTKSFAMYDPLASRLEVYAWAYTFIEIALGLMLLLRWEVRTALVMTLVLLTITTAGITKTLLDKKQIQCACLGTTLKLPMTEATFIENAIMIGMAVVMLLMN